MLVLVGFGIIVGILLVTLCLSALHLLNTDTAFHVKDCHVASFSMMRLVLNRPSGRPFIPIVVPDVTLRVYGDRTPIRLLRHEGDCFACWCLLDC